MPSVESLILEVWRQVRPAIIADPTELARRLARRGGRTFSRPPRAWCLAVRASDHRIGVISGRIDPEYATDRRDPEHFGRVVEHTVTLSAELVRALCVPVSLIGAQLCDDVARQLGTTRTGLTNARISGALRTRHVKGLLGRRGHPVAILSSPDMLDPSNAREFAMPHALWIGNECVSARVPNDLEQTVVRVPIYQPTVSRHAFAERVHPEIDGAPPGNRRRLPPPEPDYVWYKWSTSGEYLGDDPKCWRKSPDDPGTPGKASPPRRKRRRKRKPSRGGGSLVFRGWRWKCPHCGKLVRTLYRPAPPARIVLEELGECAEESADPPSRIRGKSISNLKSQICDPASFACWTCHRIRGFSAIAPNSWNDLVSYFSGGLLYGHEVPEPPGYRADARRKNRYTPQINRGSPRRDQLIRLLLAGRTSREIADEMRLTQIDVCGRIWRLCKQHGVPHRGALARKLGSKTPQPNRIEQTRRRREKVEELLHQGMTAAQIARRLGVRAKLVWQDTYLLRQAPCARGRI